MTRSTDSAGPTFSDTPEGVSPGVELDPSQLSPGALRGLVEEYVTREGTDYGDGHGGDAEWSLEEKVVEVLRQIDRGDAKIVFDLELETASVVTAPELALHVLASQSRQTEES
jgi:uncharacterized protein YheU (UPF0270 family)